MSLETVSYEDNIPESRKALPNEVCISSVLSQIYVPLTTHLRISPRAPSHGSHTRVRTLTRTHTHAHGSGPGQGYKQQEPAVSRSAWRPQRLTSRPPLGDGVDTWPFPSRVQTHSRRGQWGRRPLAVPGSWVQSRGGGYCPRRVLPKASPSLPPPVFLRRHHYTRLQTL